MSISELKEYVLGCDFCYVISERVKSSLDEHHAKFPIPSDWKRIVEDHVMGQASPNHPMTMTIVKLKCHVCVGKDKDDK